MSENNSVQPAILSPEEAMITHRDTPKQQEARAEYSHEVRQRITLGAKHQTFQSRDVIKLEWQEYGEWHELEIPIKSISADENQKIQQRNPLAIDDIDFPDVPQITQIYTDEDGQERTITMPDTSSPEAILQAQLMAPWMHQTHYDRLLSAIDADLESEEGVKVWDSRSPDEWDRDEAIKALRALKIPSEQLSRAVTKINSFSIKAAKQDATDFLLESEPPSASPQNSTKDGRNRTPRRRGQSR